MDANVSLHANAGLMVFVEGVTFLGNSECSQCKHTLMHSKYLVFSADVRDL